MSDPAPAGPLVHRCQKCNAVEAGKKLLRCRGCLAVRYCNIKHLKADLPNHKSACNGIKKARVKLGKETALVRNLPAEGDMPANVFEAGVGNFYDFPRTDDYMKARYNFAVRHLYMLGTLDSTTLALRHMQDMIRLDNFDDKYAHLIIPYAMLCLDLDQESCDFIKKWGFPTPSLANVQGTDVFEYPELIIGEDRMLERLVALLLLRLKLLVDVINVIKARKALSRTPLPVEIQNVIEKKVVRSPLSAHLYQESTAGLLKIQQKMIHGIRELSIAVNVMDKNFISELFAVGKLLNIKVRANDPEAIGYAPHVAKYSYPAWRGTEGVLQLLADAHAGGVKALETAIQGTKHSESSARGNFSRSGAEILSSMGLELIWEHLEWVVEEAAYFGPPAERPSKYLAKVHQGFWTRTFNYEQFMSDIDADAEGFSSEKLEMLRSIIYGALYGAESDEETREMMRVLARGMNIEGPQKIRTRYSESQNSPWSFEYFDSSLWKD
ncbi:unnamed protein product [Clonostachys byssicola]|uniref:MYND-type domain-containing protein n=1 Tax=Clonostachys byssicola TaxID=160290 RepID=A0A9N9UN87_9HYPO|nr:unnamed protein product [Clonostachys byssicola]